MASRNFNPRLFNLGNQYTMICGSFLPNGNSAIANSSNTGKGFTVAYTSTGKYTITLADKYAVCISATATLALATAADTFLQWGAIDVVTAKTLVLNNWDVSGAGVADIASNAANRIHFCLILGNSAKDA